jgi:hypothetical protein
MMMSTVLFWKMNRIFNRFYKQVLAIDRSKLSQASPFIIGYFSVINAIAVGLFWFDYVP